MSDPVRPHRWQPTRLPRPWDSPGKKTSGLPFPSPVHESEKWNWSRSVVSDSVWPHKRQPSRLPCPWDSSGKHTGVGCHWSGLPFPSPMHESENWKWSRSVVSDPQRPHGLQPTRLLCPWDFPDKSTGVGCHRLLQVAHWVVCNLIKICIKYFWRDGLLIGKKMCYLTVCETSFKCLALFF